MTGWVAAIFIGFLVIGLGRDRSPRTVVGLVLVVVIVVIGYEAAKLHAI